MSLETGAFQPGQSGHGGCWGSVLRAPSAGSQLRGGEKGGRQRTAKSGRNISPDQGLGPAQARGQTGCNMRFGPQTGAQCQPLPSHCTRNERMRVATVAMHPYPIIHTLPSALSPATQPQCCWVPALVPRAGARTPVLIRLLVLGAALEERQHC